MDSKEASNTNDIVYRRPRIFRRYEDGYVVREMLPEDARIVQNWYCGMGKISPYDLSITLSVFPRGLGFYLGEKDGVVIASAIRIPWSKKVFYGSLYYVDEAYRRAGYGTRLRDEVAREYVGENILCVDSVQGKVENDNKNKFGYTYGFITCRYGGVAREDYGMEKKSVNILPVSEVPFDDIVEYDNKCFIAPNNPIRRAFLEKWLHVVGGASYVALDTSGQVIGYGQRRPCYQEGDHLIGPLYSDTADVANILLQQLCKHIPGERFTIDIWQPNKEAVRMVDGFGMTKIFDISRMHVNGDPQEYKDTVFGLTSIDVCGF